MTCDECGIQAGPIFNVLRVNTLDGVPVVLHVCEVCARKTRGSGGTGRWEPDPYLDGIMKKVTGK